MCENLCVCEGAIDFFIKSIRKYIYKLTQVSIRVLSFHCDLTVLYPTRRLTYIYLFPPSWLFQQFKSSIVKNQIFEIFERPLRLVIILGKVSKFQGVWDIQPLRFNIIFRLNIILGKISKCMHGKNLIIFGKIKKYMYFYPLKMN